MKTTEIDKLINNVEESCVSIIIHTDRVDKTKNYESLKKAIQKAKALLKVQRFTIGVKSELGTKIDQLIPQIPVGLSDGLGIYISLTQSAIATFPFPVEQKVKVGKTFEARDLLYLKQYGLLYYVLSLSKKGVHLFKGELNELEEIKDEKFPLSYRDDFEYERASIADSSASSLKGFEKEKGEISEIRLKAVFREADVLIAPRLGDGRQLLLAGTQKKISLFNAVTDHEKHIIGKISGSFNKNNFIKLKESAWQAYVRFRKNEFVRLIQNLDENDNKHIAEGIEEAWTAADEGKGLMLFVERDYHHRAYRKDAQNNPHFQPPKKPYTVIPDAVDNLIKMVESKNGKVLLTENDQLKDHGHLALVLRY